MFLKLINSVTTDAKHLHCKFWPVIKFFVIYLNLWLENWKFFKKSRFSIKTSWPYCGYPPWKCIVDWDPFAITFILITENYLKLKWIRRWRRTLELRRARKRSPVLTGPTNVTGAQKKSLGLIKNHHKKDQKNITGAQKHWGSPKINIVFSLGLDGL